TAMLMTDLKIREISDGQVAMLGEYDGVIIDEAHEVPEIAASALADQFGRRGIENIISGAENFLGEQDGPSATQLAGELRGNVEAIWTHLEGLAQGEQVELKLDELAAHLEPYIELVEGLRMLEGMVSGAQIKNGHPVRETARQRRTARRIISLAQKLTEFLTSEGLVRWIETEERGKGRNRRQVTVLKYSPIEVGPFLNRFLWTRVPAALVSATLSVGGDFSYISETLGLEDPVTLDVGTPFDYEKQAKLFVPAKGHPDPSRQRSQWLSYAQNTTRDLIQAAGGGALLLFTSRRAMHDSYEMLRDVLEMAGYTCLMQGEHGTNKEIAARFSEDTHSVLFALKSFFTGVDFAGETCRLVVIDKLPFPVPTDILYAARAAKVDRQYGDWASFNRLSIPMMSLTLTQGFGRLIRSVNDRGVVAILDPRLTSKGYGKRILSALPPAPMTHDLAEVADFYAAWPLRWTRGPCRRAPQGPRRVSRPPHPHEDPSPVLSHACRPQPVRRPTRRGLHRSPDDGPGGRLRRGHRRDPPRRARGPLGRHRARHRGLRRAGPHPARPLPDAAPGPAPALPPPGARLDPDAV